MGGFGPCPPGLGQKLDRNDQSSILIQIPTKIGGSVWRLMYSQSEAESAENRRQEAEEC